MAPLRDPVPKKIFFFWKGFRTRACKDIICVLAQEWSFFATPKKCTKDPNVRISYRSSLRRGAQTRFLTLFSEGFSDPRVQGYHVYFRSGASFLQRQNSVRLLGPKRVPTCGIEEDRMRKVYIEDNCKTLIKVSADVILSQCSTVDSALQHFPFPGVKHIPQ